MSKKKNPEDLTDFIMTISEINCSKCKVGDSVCHADEDEAAENFFELGWRSTPNNVYCPTCAKKYLKS